MKRKVEVVNGLETELREALQGTLSLDSFAQKIGMFLRLMGFSDFCFLSGVVVARNHRYTPKSLIQNCSEQTVNQAINYLFDAVRGQSNKELLSLYYEEGDSLIYPQSTYKNGHYRLVTQTGNYAYFFTKKGHSESNPQVLCIVDTDNDAEQFRKNIQRNQLALDSVKRVVEEIGLDRYPEIFTLSKSEDRINIGSKPLRLLNIIAVDNVTLSQAAEMLNISVDTANKHIAKIKLELGVATLSSAVFYAANKGLIDRV